MARLLHAPSLQSMRAIKRAARHLFSARLEVGLERQLATAMRVTTRSNWVVATSEVSLDAGGPALGPFHRHNVLLLLTPLLLDDR